MSGRGGADERGREATGRAAEPAPRVPVAERVTHDDGRPPAAGVVRRFRLTVIEGPARGVTWQSTGDRCSIGSHHRNDLITDDPTVSRFHCEIAIDEDRVRVRDGERRNGTGRWTCA